MGTIAGAISFTLADADAYNYQSDNQQFISFATISNGNTGTYRERFALPHKLVRLLDLDADERLEVLNFRAMAAARTLPTYYRLGIQPAWLPVTGSNLMLIGLSSVTL